MVLEAILRKTMKMENLISLNMMKKMITWIIKVQNLITYRYKSILSQISY